MGRVKKSTIQRRNALKQINEQRMQKAKSRQKENMKPVSGMTGRKQKVVTVSCASQYDNVNANTVSTECNIPAPGVNKSTQAVIITRRKLVPKPLPIPKSNGRRIINLSSLDNLVHNIAFHSSICGKGPVTRSLESKVGMNTTIIYKCGCGKSFSTCSDGDNDTLPINQAIVWGSTQSGVGYKATTDLLATMDIPTPSFHSFKKNQDTFHEELMDAMKKEMRKWAIKEAELAREAGDLVTVNGQQYPATTVILDGGWPKRSYGHGFSANSGIAVLVGSRTRKIIYADTKIKTCFICDKKRTGPVPPHKCYKNFDGPSTAMESAIILEAFQKSIQDYGLVYWKFIGDGDSSVHAKVQNVYEGLLVEKHECTNHVLRNFTTRLIDISLNRVRGKDPPKISLEERKLFNPVVGRFRTGLTQAIKHHHENQSPWKDLYDDILNIRYHIYGEHQNCKQYFCKGSKQNEINRVPTISKLPIWKAIGQALERPASLAPSLILKESSNAAETFMSVACKFVEGKRKNFGQGYLYRLRMAGAVFSYNESSFWADKAYKYIKNKTVGQSWITKSAIANRIRAKSRKYIARKPLKVPQLGPPSFDYGDNPQRPDLPEVVLLARLLLKKSELQVDDAKANEIERSTTNQAESTEWLHYRQCRITASIAGKLYKLLDSTDNTCTLNEYFGRSRKSDQMKKAMDYGKNNEQNAIDIYESVMKFSKGTVKKAGFFVYVKNGIFGASPDGLIGPNGLLEVKCPYTLFIKKESPKSWPTISKSSSLAIDKNDNLFLKKNHIHYYQCIMQIYVTGRQYCDYFVWSEQGHFRERIERSQSTDILWGKMEQKLERIWMNDIGPELVDSRFERGYTEYKCPDSRLAARKKKAASKNES